jgi:hypothetical protein
MNRHVAKPLAVAGVLGACAFAVPTASALQDQRGPDPQNQAPVVQQKSDLRSPDARDAVSAGQQRNAVSNDLRSPDARDAGSAGQQRNAVSNDLRSPDAQDAAGNTSLASYAVPTVVKVHPSNGFDWDDAGIGAGGMLAAIVIAGGATLLVIRRRPGRSGVSPAAG